MDLYSSELGKTPALVIQSYRKVRKNSPVSNVTHPLANDRKNGQLQGLSDFQVAIKQGILLINTLVSPGSNARLPTIWIGPRKIKDCGKGV